MDLIPLTVFHLIQFILMDTSTDKMEAEWITNTISIRIHTFMSYRFYCVECSSSYKCLFYLKAK